MFEKNNQNKTEILNKKLFSAEEIAFNIRENLRYLIDTKKISFKNLTIGTGASDVAIKNILNGTYVNIDSYLVYRIAHYFGYEVDVFIQSNANQLAVTKPTISVYQAPLDAKQFQENYINKISNLIEQKKLSQTEIKNYSSLKKDRSKLTIYDLHRAEHILDTKIMNLFASELSKSPNLKTLNKFHLEAICDKVLTLIKKHNISIYELALAINEQPLATINFFAGVSNSPTNNTKLLFKIANHLEVDFNALLSAYETELLQNSNILDNVKKFKKISKNLSIAEVDIIKNYRSNLSYYVKLHGIKESHLAKMLGHSTNLIESGTNPIVVQDVANFFGYDPHTWLTCKSFQLPQPNPALIEKILKKTAKILAIGAIGVASVAPAMALDYAVDEAYHALSNYENDAIIPNLPSEHPLNLHIKLGILTALIALEHVIVAEKLVETTIRTTLKDAINNVTEDKPLVEKLLSPPINLINIFNDVTEDYLENFKPIERDSKAWFETFNMLVTQSAKMIYERFDSLKLEAKEEFEEALIKAEKESSNCMSHYRNMEDVKNYFSRIYASEMADHSLEKTDDVTIDYDNSEIEEILENIMNNHPSGIHHSSPKLPGALEKIHHFAKKVISDKSDDYLEKIICSGVNTTSYYLTQGVLNYAIAVTTLEFGILAILLAQPGIDKAADIIGDFAENLCHDTLSSLKSSTNSSNASLQIEHFEESPQLNTDSFFPSSSSNDLFAGSTHPLTPSLQLSLDSPGMQILQEIPQVTSNANQINLNKNHQPEFKSPFTSLSSRDLFAGSTHDLTPTLQSSSNSPVLQIQQEISKATSKVNQISLNKNHQPESKSSQGRVEFFHPSKTNFLNSPSKISDAPSSNNNSTKWQDISIITRPLPPPPGIPDSSSLLTTTPNYSALQVEVVSGNYECMRVNNQSSIRFFDKGVCKTVTAPSGYTIHGLYCRPEGSSDSFKLMKSGSK